MSWVLLTLLSAGIAGGLISAVSLTNQYAPRIAGSLIALGFLGVLLWLFYLTGITGGMMMR